MSKNGQHARKAAPAPAEERGAALRWALVAAVGVLAAGLLALGFGFRALSDDDYARVLLAQRFARAPHVDPTGSSWLPFPFWVMGAAMQALGPTLGAARAVALGWAAASGLLLWAAGRVAGLSPAAAAFGALAPFSAPSLGPLAAAPVPELPTAALATYGVAAACFGERRALVAGGAALVAACLSRYEAWPPALAAAAILAARLAFRRLDAGPAGALGRRAPGGRARPDGATKGGRAARAGAALLAIAAPLAWVAWNHLAHGDALAFVRRVVAYHAGVSREAPTVFGVLGGYPEALAREAPGLVLAAAIALGSGRGARRRWALPLGAALFSLLSLIVAQAWGGAPTHHPERALTPILCLLGIFVAAEATRAARAWLAEGGARASWSRSGAPPLGRRGRLLGGAALSVALVTAAGFVWRAGALAAEFGPARADEIELGRALTGRVGAGERVLVAPASYGYIAALVAFGRPDDVAALVPKSVDPRSSAADPFESATSLARAAAAAGARWVLAAEGQRPAAEAAGWPGAPLVGAWWLYDAGAAPAPPAP